MEERYDAQRIPRARRTHWATLARDREKWKSCWYPLESLDDQRDDRRPHSDVILDMHAVREQISDHARADGLSAEQQIDSIGNRPKTAPYRGDLPSDAMSYHMAKVLYERQRYKRDHSTQFVLSNGDDDENRMINTALDTRFESSWLCWRPNRRNVSYMEDL
ncbi:hypothetical protein KIN20_000469 [Parelaphostrongylus tenuis]|uniref:Uncharacterized protein n=1 Tax=Parelaphostrongylus tenuis TaxID=148309 RepID=A0AAD5MBE9_PARTN|nr:hypothetical protein KIN20_000469 [Parelaphostrongylus tenuis]